MTTQADLLELAKQGNPQAIASLMNFALESKGTTVKAVLNENCLHIFLDSEQPLNQQTMVGFVQNGLINLAAQSIQSAKLYARKAGQEMPIWTESIQLHPTSPNSPAIPVVPTENQELRLPSFNTFAPSQTFAGPPLKKLTTHKAAKLEISARFSEFSRRSQQTLRFFINTVLPQINSSRKNKYVLGGAAVLAFVCGGVVAVILNSQAASTSPSSAASKSAIAMEQMKAKQYLAQMSKAQKRFYQNNGRFASTLEELERSAAIMFQSSHYAYKLTIHDQTQSELTANPKVDGMKSYTSVVMLSQAENGSSAIASKICETTQPSNTPPDAPQLSGVSLQCPATSTDVPY